MTDSHKDLIVWQKAMALVTQLHIARNLGYLNETEFHRPSPTAEEVGRVLNGLLSAIVKQLDSPESSELRAGT